MRVRNRGQLPVALFGINTHDETLNNARSRYGRADPLSEKRPWLEKFMRIYSPLHFLLVFSDYFRLFHVCIEIAQTLNLILVHSDHGELEMSIEAARVLHSLTQIRERETNRSPQI